MNQLDALLDTLATCRRALGPAETARHAARLDLIERMIQVMVPDDMRPLPARPKRGGDPAQRAHAMLCRAVLEQTTDLIAMCDEDGRYLFVNAAHLPVLGYAPAFLHNTSAFDLIHPDDRSGVTRAWQTLQATGALRITFRYRHASGAYRWLEAQASATGRGGGRQVVLVSRDVTARREAEAEARASAERFRLLVEGVTDYAIIMLDPVGRVIGWNSGAEQLTGYREAAIIGRHVGCLYPPEQVAQGLPDDALYQAATHGTAMTDHMLLRQDGVCVPVRDVVTSLYDGGVLRGFAMVTRDISERKELEARLRQYELRERALLAVLPHQVVCVRRDGLVVAQLDSGDPWGEHTDALAAGTHLRDLFPDVADCLLAAIDAALASAEAPAVPRLLAPVRDDTGNNEWRVVAYGDQHVLLLRRDVRTWRPVSAVSQRD